METAQALGRAEKSADDALLAHCQCLGQEARGLTRGNSGQTLQAGLTLQSRSYVPFGLRNPLEGIVDLLGRKPYE